MSPLRRHDVLTMNTIVLQSIVFISGALMIRTQQEALLLMHSAIAGEGVQIWRYAHLVLNLPYLLVTYQFSNDRERLRQTVLISRVEELLSLFVGEGSSKNELIQVALMSPPSINQTSGWEMMEIAEIWIGKKPSNGLEVTAYVSKDGKKIIDTVGSKVEDSIVEPKLIFSSKNIKSN